MSEIEDAIQEAEYLIERLEKDIEEKKKNPVIDPRLIQKPCISDGSSIPLKSEQTPKEK